MFRVGNIINSDYKSLKGIERLILEVFDDGTYLWSYPGLEQGENNEFYSGNSSDPKLELWKLK